MGIYVGESGRRREIRDKSRASIDRIDAEHNAWEKAQGKDFERKISDMNRYWFNQWVGIQSFSNSQATQCPEWLITRPSSQQMISEGWERTGDGKWKKTYKKNLSK